MSTKEIKRAVDKDGRRYAHRRKKRAGIRNKEAKEHCIYTESCYQHNPSAGFQPFFKSGIVVVCTPPFWQSVVVRGIVGSRVAAKKRNPSLIHIVVWSQTLSFPVVFVITSTPKPPKVSTPINFKHFTHSSGPASQECLSVAAVFASKTSRCKNNGKRNEPV